MNNASTTRLPNPVLQARDISLVRNGQRLLNNVSLRVHAGERVMLLGPNGAGKSTLLRVLSGEWAAQSGDIRLCGEPLAALPLAVLARRRAVMPQQVTLSFPMLAEEVVAQGLPGREAGNSAHPSVAPQMAWCDVGHLAGRLYTSLSGGEQQRVQLARVLVQLRAMSGERLLLLDEATSALDPAQQYRLMSQLAALAQQENTALIMACHDLSLAAAYGSRILLLADGECVADGPPESVLTKDNLASVYGLDACLDTRGPLMQVRVHGVCPSRHASRDASRASA
ncbi:heme ABC transporter ATP-binding protein [Alcanivorax sp. JB21]|uniref:heme ABC transporter ATP-binding protein n=1 Tax=Alcanivorax limicola TaxID=2874102 RepID=UPI001CBD1B95|nr:heme ABC transporter ATP-binding protein [Alcanivorax limicola]MBZ2188545.1 heme ABC transporter ATP-binding protein [Alcanivorax limicola]